MPRFMRQALLSTTVLVALAFVMTTVGCKKSTAATADGPQLFVNACSRCHGTEGAGGLPLYDGGPSPQDFRDHAFQRSRTDEQLKMTIQNGKGAGMPPFGTMFDDAQLDALVATIRGFDPERK